MNELVFLKNKQALTTSRTVAEIFEKEHVHVMRDIRELREQMEDVSKFGLMFHDATYLDSYGRKQPMYLMNRDGFSLLAMGFTGERALKFKLDYIAAFNAMERELKRQSERPRCETPLADKVTDIGETALALERYITGLKRGISLAQAIALAEARDGCTYAPIKKLLAPAEHKTGYLNATQIGEKLGLGTGKKAARKANALLKEAAYQYRDGRDWRLTDEGTAYGEELPWHSHYRIRWDAGVLDVLQEEQR